MSPRSTQPSVVPSRKGIHIGTDINIGASRKRTLLEDRLRAGLVRTELGPLYLGVVADGIGGENAGERAAELTIRGIFHHIQEETAPDLLTLMKDAVEAVNDVVHAEAQAERQKHNMGSTVAIAAVQNERLYIASAGDSRVYLVRNRAIRQLTVDHTWEYEVVRLRKLSRQEAARNPRRDEITRSVGYEPQILVDLGLHMNDAVESERDSHTSQGLHLLPGDHVVVCTDGLIKQRPNSKAHFVEPGEIVRIVNEYPAQEAAGQLVKLALTRGVDDNVSVIVMEMPGSRLTMQRSLASIRAFFSSPLRAAMISALAFITLVGLVLLFRAVSITPVSRVPASPGRPGKAIVEEMTRLLFYGEERVRQAGGSYDFADARMLATGRDAGTYACLRLAYEVIVCMAEDTSIRLTDWQPAIAVLTLDRGRVLIHLPAGYSPVHRTTIVVPAYGQASVSGSIMGVLFDPQEEMMYVDCIEGECIVEYNHHQDTLTAGTKIRIALTKSGELQPGISYGVDINLWTFAPAQIPVFTPTPLPTADLGETLIPPPIPGLHMTDTRQPTLTPRLTDTRQPTLTGAPTDTRWPTSTSTQVYLYTPIPSKTPGKPPSHTPKK